MSILSAYSPISSSHRLVSAFSQHHCLSFRLPFRVSDSFSVSSFGWFILSSLSCHPSLVCCLTGILGSGRKENRKCSIFYLRLDDEDQSCRLEKKKKANGCMMHDASIRKRDERTDQRWMKWWEKILRLIKDGDSTRLFLILLPRIFFVSTACGEWHWVFDLVFISKVLSSYSLSGDDDTIPPSCLLLVMFREKETDCMCRLVHGVRIILSFLSSQNSHHRDDDPRTREGRVFVPGNRFGYEEEEEGS